MGLILQFHGLHSSGISCARYSMAGEFGPLMSTGITCSTLARKEQRQPDNQQCQYFPFQYKTTDIRPTLLSPLPGRWCPAAKLLPKNFKNILRLKLLRLQYMSSNLPNVWATRHEETPSLLPFSPEKMQKCWAGKKQNKKNQTPQNNQPTKH